jgi:outer membrane biosynthesis protein TonB
MRPDNHSQNLNHSFAHLSTVSLKPNSTDQHFNIRISRNTLLAIVFSLLLHALIFFAVPQIKFDTPPSAPASAIQVSLAPPVIPTQVIAPTQEPQPPSPEPPPQVKPPPSAVPKVIAQKPLPNKTPSFVVPQPPEPAVKPELDKRPLKEPQVKELPVEQQYTDMASYVKAMQSKRQDSEAVAAQINAEAAARERGPSEEQLREERIKKNLKYGTNGIFEITSLGQRNATFAFRGWTNDYSASKRQFYEVEASSGQDVRLIMIRRMIALIREHYDGDFQWESHRLGRSVMQSARPEDNSGLEDFLMMEFFGSNYKSTQY